MTTKLQPARHLLLYSLLVRYLLLLVTIKDFIPCLMALNSQATVKNRRQTQENQGHLWFKPGTQYRLRWPWVQSKDVTIGIIFSKCIQFLYTKSSNLCNKVSSVSSYILRYLTRITYYLNTLFCSLSWIWKNSLKLLNVKFYVKHWDFKTDASFREFKSIT